MVKALVASGITICATIHSPTPYCFNLFDTLMILLRGHVVYFGENGARALHGCSAFCCCNFYCPVLIWHLTLACAGSAVHSLETGAVHVQ